MATQKQYASLEFYEKKLAKVMSRFGIEPEKYDWDCNRSSCWVQFYYKGGLYRFEHSVQKAQEHGHKLSYGSDAFAQVVLALEDLARLVDRGIYDLQDWVAGMKSLPPAQELPSFCKLLGLDHLPQSEDEIEKAFRTMAKHNHPDVGGSDSFMRNLLAARTEAEDWFKGQKG